MSPSHRSLRFKLLALALSGLASVVGAEILVRASIGSPLIERLPILEIRANPRRGWEMTPGQVHHTYQHPVRVNRLGLRGPELDSKAPGEIRILALGDSLVYGQGVADDETIPAYLEASLNKHARKMGSWTVVNGGVRAYNTRQEVALLEELDDRLEPDLVLLFWYWNDLQDVDVDRVYERIRDSGPVAFDTKTRISGWARVQWHLTQIPRRSALLMLAHDLVLFGSAEATDPDATITGLGRLDTELDRLQELARASGFDLLIAIIPDPNSLSGDHPSQDLERVVAQRATLRGVPHVRLHDVLARLAANDGRLPVLPFDGHYRPAANQTMAQEVAQAILTLRSRRVPA